MSTKIKNNIKEIMQYNKMKLPGLFAGYNYIDSCVVILPENHWNSFFWLHLPCNQSVAVWKH